MTIIMKFTNDKLGYLYKEKPHFIQIRLNEMKPNQGENIEYGLLSPLLEVVEGYSGGRRENLRKDDQMVMLVIEFSLYINFRAIGSFCL